MSLQVNTQRPVSYTHLDVYKRQMEGEAREDGVYMLSKVQDVSKGSEMAG